jgi:hypothetical protein
LLNVGIAVVASATFLTAQTNRGGIAGTIFDKTGAVVAGANITVTNKGTNQQIKVKANNSGGYILPSLDPVMYAVTVEAEGFKKTTVENIKVDTATVATVDVTLEPGTVTTAITVQAEATVVNTESGTTGSTVTQREIQDVPLVNRSVLDLAVTLPNVSGDVGSENPVIVTVTTCPGCNISINGGRPLGTLFLADGTNNTGVSLGRTVVSFSPETVQEFTVQTSAYSAEYSTTGGGVINATTKSGTNELTGTALWYNRNPYFGAAPFTQAAANRPVATLKYNQFSLAAGGPIYIPKIYNGKNKTFWFAAFEPNYRRDRLDQYGLLPTDAMRTGDFSGLVNTPSGWLPTSVVQQFTGKAPANALTASDSVIYNQFNVVGNQFTQQTLASGATYVPFAGNKIPASMLDSTAIKALAYLAPAKDYYLNSNGLISNAVLPRLLQQDDKRYTVRIDQILGDKNRLNGRYTATPLVKRQNTPLSALGDAAEYSYAKQGMVAYTHTFSPVLFNDLRLDYTRGRFSITNGPAYDATSGANANTLFGLPNVTAGGTPGFTGLFPGSSLGGGGSTATSIGGGGSTQVEDREERYALTDIVYWTHGKMNFKFGFEWSKSLQNVTPLFAALGGQYPFSNIQTDSNGASSGTGGQPFASFLLGVPNANVTLRSVLIPYYYRYKAGAGFVQNDWRIHPNLTLNLGVRYNLELPRTEKYDNQGVFRPDLAQSVNLPAPLTLQDGEVITKALIPPFVFAGHGNSRYLTPADYLDFEPRFGFAWSPNFLKSYRVTLRGGYGLSHVPLTGAARLPLPDFGATANFAVATPSATANPNAILRLGENPPVIIGQTPQQAVGAPSNGIVAANSLYYQSSFGGFAVSPNFHTPYIQNWNVTASWQTNSTTVIELGYTGLKGTHLFEPHENINGKDVPLLSSETAAGVSTTATINDPLGRINPATGKVLTVQNGSLGSAYLGFSSLYNVYDASANSIRHGGYVSVVHRVGAGITFTGNYTYAKSIDDSSSAGLDKNVLTPVGGQVDGQVAFGGTRANDRSVSTYDQRHVINGTFIYDVPFGHGRKYMTRAPWPVEFLTGGWTVAGVEHLNSGFPYIPVLADSNLLGDLTHTARPDVNPSVPLINPLYDRNCPTGSGCQPYLNPSAFSRPALGALGTAPRTLDGIRGPWAQSFDISVQKNFRLGEKRRLQFRVDALNLLNHPIFRTFPNNAGGTDFMNAPSTAALSAADYNTWASANGQPLSTTTAGTALLNQINNMVNAVRVGGAATGALPLNFFAIPLPDNFYGKQPANFDITTLNGFKQFRLRQAYVTSFGDLYQAGQSRYIQFGLKLYF